MRGINGCGVRRRRQSGSNAAAAIMKSGVKSQSISAMAPYRSVARNDGGVWRISGSSAGSEANSVEKWHGGG